MTGGPMAAAAVVVYGASGHGKVVADVARSMGLRLLGFLDDDVEKAGRLHFGHPVLSWEQVLSLRGREVVAFALGVGANRAREACLSRLEQQGLEVATLVHGAATVAPSATLGPGTVVMAGAVVNADARVGRGCIVNTGSVVEHDDVLEDFVHLSPNAALGGNVRIGARTHVGLGAVVLPGVPVGVDVRVGAGAVVHRPVADRETVVGVPARALRA